MSNATREQLLRQYEQTAMMVLDEIKRAKELHPGEFNSLHEGFGIMKEEVDELWDEVRAKKPSAENLRSEAIQIAAMAIRFAVELPKEKPENK